MKTWRNTLKTFEVFKVDFIDDNFTQLRVYIVQLLEEMTQYEGNYNNHYKFP